MGCLIPLSFICGIFAGILIWRGGEMSKRTEEVEARLRGALENERRSVREGDDRTGLGSNSVRDDEPIREKQKAHTAVQDPSNGVKRASFDANREHGIGLQDKPGDSEEGACERSTDITDVIEDRPCGGLNSEDRLPPGKSEQLPQTSRRVSGTFHPSYHHETFKEV